MYYIHATSVSNICQKDHARNRWRIRTFLTAIAIAALQPEWMFLYLLKLLSFWCGIKITSIMPDRIYDEATRNWSDWCQSLKMMITDLRCDLQNDCRTFSFSFFSFLFFSLLLFSSSSSGGDGNHACSSTCQIYVSWLRFKLSACICHLLMCEIASPCILYFFSFSSAIIFFSVFVERLSIVKWFGINMQKLEI